MFFFLSRYTFDDLTRYTFLGVFLQERFPYIHPPSLPPSPILSLVADFLQSSQTMENVRRSEQKSF